jgi:amino acid transporter
MDFGRALFGPIGGTIFAFMVAFSCFGALNGFYCVPFNARLVLKNKHTGSFFTSSRLVYAAGREHYLPAMFGRLHKTRQTPMNATLLQAGITVSFIIIGGGFRSLINFSVVASWAFYFLTVGRKYPLGFKSQVDCGTGPWFSDSAHKRAYAGKASNRP